MTSISTKDMDQLAFNGMHSYIVMSSAYDRMLQHGCDDATFSENFICACDEVFFSKTPVFCQFNAPQPGIICRDEVAAHDRYMYFYPSNC